MLGKLTTVSSLYMNKDISPKLQQLSSQNTSCASIVFILYLDLLVHPDLDWAGGVPGDQVVAGDDLVWTIVILAGLVLGRHHALLLVAVLISQ